MLHELLQQYVTVEPGKKAGTFYTFLKVDHQSFVVNLYPPEHQEEAEWWRNQLLIALERMVQHVLKELPGRLL